MRTSTRTVWLLGIALVLTLTGCGSSSSESDGTAHGKKKFFRTAPTHDPASRSPDDMVAAVSAGKPGPVGLKFEIRQSPQAGQPLDVDIAVLPDAPAINRVSAKFQAGEGLELVDGQQLEQVDKPAAGSVIRHVVRVTPKEDGIYTLNATVSVDLAGDSLTRVFSIPVIVGDGMPESTAKAEVAAGPSAAGMNSKAH
ncbi:MAG TPA: hypothetical protein VFB37_13335 [Steroidobacteraceae bacterium]|nr:hypothetical protein [Steroidobacteraceae bacterium]